MPQKPTLIVFIGSTATSPVEQMVEGARQAITTDTIEKACRASVFDRIIVATNDRKFARSVKGQAIVEMDQGPFHFGKRLADLIAKHNIDKPFYIGGGSVPLLTAEELAKIVEEFASKSNAVISNNYFSADLVAFTPGSAIAEIELPTSDNPLPQLLHHQAGLENSVLPRTAVTQFDVDTPTDLLVLKVHPGSGPNTRRFIESLDLNVSKLKQAMSLFTSPEAEVLVSGRVGSHIWACLEKDTACRVRMLSEERGMRADSRQEQGKVRSILGFYVEQVGIPRFFQTVAELGNAAFIDTRVIFHHLKLNLPASDRFFSDLSQPDNIGISFAREFTRAAMEASIPIVLGGHSLVSGGMMALIDAAWLEYETKQKAEEV